MLISTYEVLVSLTGDVIQAIGKVDFGDSPRIGNQSEAKNSHRKIHFKHKINATIVLWDRVSQIPTGADKFSIC